MNETTYIGQRLASQRAAQLDRENEMIRRQTERRVALGHPARRTWLDAALARLATSSLLARRHNPAVVAAD